MRKRLMATIAAILFVSTMTTACGSADSSGGGTDDFPSVEGDFAQSPTIGSVSGDAPSELKVRVVKSGDGAEVKPAATVAVDYWGQTWEGKKFDESFSKNPAVFPLSGLIKGWQEGLAGTHVGDRVEIVVPPDLGYGAKDQTDQAGNVTIPANSTLVFVVDIYGAVDPTDTSALASASEVPDAQLPDWMKVSGELGTKPNLEVDKDAAKTPEETQVVVLAEGQGDPIDADDYVAAHLTGWSFDGQQLSTWDQGQMYVTSGPVGSSRLFNGMKIGTRAVFITNGETLDYDQTQALPAGVYVMEYASKMKVSRG